MGLQHLDYGDLVEAGVRVWEYQPRRLLAEAAPSTARPGAARASAQRVRWFKRGFDSGDPRKCDTFGVGPYANL